jgi:hypothetical protein
MTGKKDLNGDQGVGHRMCQNRIAEEPPGFLSLRVEHAGNEAPDPLLVNRRKR